MWPLELMATPTASAMIISLGILKKSRTSWNLSSGAFGLSGALAASCAESARQQERQTASRRGFILVDLRNVGNRHISVAQASGASERATLRKEASPVVIANGLRYLLFHNSIQKPDFLSAIDHTVANFRRLQACTTCSRMQSEFLNPPVGNLAGVNLVVGAAIKFVDGHEFLELLAALAELSENLAVELHFV